MKRINVNKDILKIFENSISANPEGVKGQDKVQESIKLYLSLEKVEDDKTLLLETSTYQYLKACMEKAVWRADKLVLLAVDKAFKVLESAESYDANEQN